jgi:3-hydroxymyristoyl/3-hydroxydecanoyl-(acyl carrier protein) dehydratase
MFSADSPYLLQGNEVPFTLLIEALSQLSVVFAARKVSIIYAILKKLKTPKGIPYLIGINNSKIYGTAHAGDKIDLNVKVIKRIGRFLVVKGTAFNDNGLILEGELSFAFG